MSYVKPSNSLFEYTGNLPHNKVINTTVNSKNTF